MFSLEFPALIGTLARQRWYETPIEEDIAGRFEAGLWFDRAGIVASEFEHLLLMVVTYVGTLAH